MPANKTSATARGAVETKRRKTRATIEDEAGRRAMADEGDEFITWMAKITVQRSDAVVPTASF